MSLAMQSLSDPYTPPQRLPDPPFRLDDRAESLIRERFDGARATAAAIGAELGDIPAYQIITWARELGVGNTEQPHPHRASSARASLKERACVMCGATYTPTSPVQKYCSKACSAARSAQLPLVRTGAPESALASTSAIVQPVEAETAPSISIVHTDSAAPTEVAEVAAPEPPLLNDHALLANLLDRLPANDTWTGAQRARWLAAFTACLDFEITQEEPYS